MNTDIITVNINKIVKLHNILALKDIGPLKDDAEQEKQIL